MKSRLFLASSLFSLAVLGWLLSQVQWQLFATAFSRLNFNLLPIIIGCAAANIAWRAWRWMLVSGAAWRLYPAFWQATNLGYLANLIYPARAGEVLRMVALSALTPISMGHAVTSAALDRLLDVIALGFLLLLVIAVQGEIVAGVNLGNRVAIFMLVALLGLALLLLVAQRAQAWLHAQPSDSSRLWLQRLRTLLQQAMQGLQASRKGGLFSLTLLMSFAALGADAFYKWLMMLAFGWDLPYFTGLVTASFVLLGNSLPAAPGAIGVYEAACVLALSFYGIGTTDALAYAVAIHSTETLIIGVQGGAVILDKGLNLKEMLKKSPST